MSWQAETRAWAVATAAAFALSAIGFKVAKIPAVPNLSATVTKVNGTLDNINGATGTWSAASAQQIASFAAIERDLRAELWHVDRVLLATTDTMTAAKGAVITANAQMQHIAPLLDSARDATAAIPGTLAYIQADTHTLMLNGNGAVSDVRDFINQPSLTGTLTNVQSITQSAAGISEDARKVADKATADYLKPVPWYLYPVKRSGQLLDIGAAVARHTP